jgi:predicted NBD/HSP70 family sugar kinase
MYLAIDIGGSKTLFAVFNDSGHIVEQYKQPTNKNYPDFLKEVSEAINNELGHHKFIACCCGVPGEIDRVNGIALVFGNLPWRNTPIQKDLAKILGPIPIKVENDANLAGLAEASLVKDRFTKVMYLTVSTGIKSGFIVDNKIEPNLADAEPGQMVLEHEGKIQKWEDFASGRALFAKYGKKASEIEDPAIWKEFSYSLAQGINELLAVMQPKVVIIGGGVGSHYEKFAPYLEEELNKMSNDMVKVPPIIKAQRPEEAVVYGCYQLIRETVI